MGIANDYDDGTGHDADNDVGIANDYDDGTA
jgi:hypothetical protein